MILPPPPTGLDFYIGTYTDEGGGKGIYRSRLDPKTGSFASPVLAASAPSPSYLALAPDGRTLYAVHESEATVGAYAITPDRGLRLLNVEPSRGTAPCHLALDPAGRTLFVANYGGTLAAFPIRRDGQIGPAGAVFTNEGTGPDRGRQDAPHPHAVGTDPTGRFLYACDLGTDEVLTFRIGEKRDELTLTSRVKTPGGVGPRHLVLGKGGRFLYTNNEMRPGVTAFARDPKTGALTARSTVPSLGPGTWPSGANTAEIVLHPNGQWLYVSNRGAETIALFRIGANGLPVFVEAVVTGVREPRGFALDPSGRWLVAAGQRSNSIVSLRVDAKTGRLTPTGKSITVGKPVSIVFLAPPVKGEA